MKALNKDSEPEKKTVEKKKKVLRGQTFTAIPEDSAVDENDNLSDLYEIAPERLEVIGLPPERQRKGKSRALSLPVISADLGAKQYRAGYSPPEPGMEDDPRQEPLATPPRLNPAMLNPALLPGGQNRGGRRMSFLSNTGGQRMENSRSLTPDMADQIVTPFAQILHSLRTVRDNHVELHGLESNEETGETTNGKHSDDNTVRKDLALDMLEALDWSLQELEKMPSYDSVSEMAAKKFKLMLNRELVNFSQSSKSGKIISNHIRSTYYGRNKFISEDAEEENIGQRVSMENLVARKKEKEGVMNKVMAAQNLTSKSLFMEETIPKYGVHTTQPEKLEQVMDNINKWGLDVFSANKIIKDQRVLTCTAFRIFKERDLLNKCKIPERTLLNFLMTLEDNYLKDVQYHNHLHAADVTHSVHVLLRSGVLEDNLTPLEILASIIAPAVHDVDHPGLTNAFLISTSSELALMYNDESVLENHHLAVAFKLLQIPECDILANITQKQRVSVRKMVIDMVLATDMSKHMSLLADLKTMVETKKVKGPMGLDSPSDKMKVLQNMIHCCDLSNPTKPLEQYKQWVDRLMEEYFLQGDKERELGLDLSPLCDRHTVNVSKSQVGFIDFVVHPLWETWSELVSPAAQDILSSLESNRTYYDAEIHRLSPEIKDEKEAVEDNTNSKCNGDELFDMEDSPSSELKKNRSSSMPF